MFVLLGNTYIIYVAAAEYKSVLSCSFSRRSKEKGVGSGGELVFSSSSFSFFDFGIPFHFPIFQLASFPFADGFPILLLLLSFHEGESLEIPKISEAHSCFGFCFLLLPTIL